jgi:hypothetical protein
LSEGEYFHELAKQFRQLAEGFHRLGAVAFDPISSAGFKHWGDVLMVQADALDHPKDKPEGGTDKG